MAEETPITATEQDFAMVAEKLRNWHGTLTPGERAALAAIVRQTAGTDRDVEGYGWFSTTLGYALGGPVGAFLTETVLNPQSVEVASRDHRSSTFSGRRDHRQ